MLVETVDAKLNGYKPYLKGFLTSQLLCRLSVQPADMVKVEGIDTNSTPQAVDFWKILGIYDEFDKSYIISQVERFCSLFSIHGGMLDDDLLDSTTALSSPVNVDAATAAAAAAAGITVSPNGGERSHPHNKYLHVLLFAIGVSVVNSVLSS